MGDEKKEKETKLIVSLDFDKCLHRKDELMKHGAKDLTRPAMFIGKNWFVDSAATVETNKELFQNLAKEIDESSFDEVVMMVGSNRQDMQTDLFNATMSSPIKCTSPSAIAGITQIKNHVGGILKRNVKCEVDGFLMADVYSKKKVGDDKVEDYAPGELFRAQSELMADKDKYIDVMMDDQSIYSGVWWLFDDSKLSILYAQMHRAASAYPNENIEFRFYDDDKDDILFTLAQFFKANPEFIPGNVKLVLNHYEGPRQDGSLVQQVEVVQGVGQIDENYLKNIKHMAVCVGLNPDPAEPNREKQKFISPGAPDSDVNKLKQFLTTRTVKKSDDSRKDVTQKTVESVSPSTSGLFSTTTQSQGGGVDRVEPPSSAPKV